MDIKVICCHKNRIIHLLECVCVCLRGQLSNGNYYMWVQDPVGPNCVHLFDVRGSFSFFLILVELLTITL
jgi:hypothetical protein